MNSNKIVFLAETVMNAAPDKILKPLKSPSSSTDDEDDNDDIEQELEGSADQALDF